MSDKRWCRVGEHCYCISDGWGVVATTDTVTVSSSGLSPHVTCCNCGHRTVRSGYPTAPWSPPPWSPPPPPSWVPYCTTSGSWTVSSSTDGQNGNVTYSWGK